VDNFMIVGCGGIGFRHFQGMQSQFNDANIILVDPVFSNKEKCLEYENESKGSVEFYKSVSEVPKIKIKGVIIATTTTGRVDLITLLAQIIEYEFIIIEKPIAQSKAELKELKKNDLKSGIMINHPYRYYPFFIKLNEKLPRNILSHLKITGNSWGLACNSWHFIDLGCWMFNSELESIKWAEGCQWIKSKRNGYEEILGSFIAQYKNGSTLECACESGVYKLEISLTTENTERDELKIINDQLSFCSYYEVDEKDRVSLYQSELTGTIVLDAIKGKCKLPKVSDTYNSTYLFLESMEDLRKRLFNDRNEKLLPIT
jgi:predicted dehydrogenase